MAAVSSRLPSVNSGVDSKRSPVSRYENTILAARAFGQNKDIAAYSGKIKRISTVPPRGRFSMGSPPFLR